MRVAVPAHAGGVDQDDAVGEQRVGNLDFETHDPPPLRKWGARIDSTDIRDRHRDPGLRAAGIAVRREHQLGTRLGAVRQQHRHRGGGIVADRADVQVQQSVDETALPLVQLPGDDDAPARVTDPVGRHLEAADQIVAARGARRRDGLTEY